MMWMFIAAIVLFASPVVASVASLVIAARRAARWQARATTDELGVVSSRK